MNHTTDPASDPTSVHALIPASTPAPDDASRDIGLALSGGGSRAMAFHLGCLRALHDQDLLDRVRVVSGISGGALLAALWAYGPADFDTFDQATVALLRSGLQRRLALRALTPHTAVRNLTSAATTATGTFTPGPCTSRIRRANRTEAFATLLAATCFGDTTTGEVTHPGLEVMLTATDLTTGNAVRFGSAASSCSRYGRIVEPVPVATAVAASAAYPLLLPALERRFTFTRAGQDQQQTVLLTDGGVYDNLGLSGLEPGRDTTYTDHVYNTPYIISCDAGRGDLASKTPHFLLARVARSFEITHQRSQAASRARLHEWARHGRIEGFVMAYLGMRDDHLDAPPADLVPRQAVAAYPTNFAAMPGTDIDQLTRRGEQLTRTLIPLHCSGLTHH